MAVVTTSAGVANSALTNLFSKWGDLLGSLDPKFKGKCERVLKAMGTCMQFLSEAVAYFRLRNQREEQRLMHAINGNTPAKVRAGPKIKKVRTPSMTKVRIVSVLEAQQMPKASHVCDMLRHKDAKRTTLQVCLAMRSMLSLSIGARSCLLHRLWRRLPLRFVSR